ncbi:MAG TPA: protease pro-enzyme activation domain-containing protein [Candidatus Limnocylindria bacterium]|nr:protease pro-enzyme activation domain-containing protein [Candidatus Limnocylindria bacterium]
MTNKLFRLMIGCAALVLSLPAAAQAPHGPASSRVAVPLGATTGLQPSGAADGRALLRLGIELQPRGDLDGLAVRMSDPTSLEHRTPLSHDAFVARFGRTPEARAIFQYLRENGATDVELAGDGLVVGGILSIAQAERLFHTRWLRYTDGTRTVLAPAEPLTVPFGEVRAVRGAVVATTPRLADTRPSFTYFRGNWYDPVRFRAMTGAVDGGGANQRIVVVEDSSDRFGLIDVKTFLAAPGAPPGADIARVTERSFVFKAASSDCGRDDRGQEPALDVDAAITMAPLADVVVDYDDVCSAGNDGTVALARALDLDPTVLVFPFAVGPVDTSIAARYGSTPIPILEALVRGIPLVVPAGDDGAYGYREKGVEEARIAWPCASPYVVCAGGTQLGDREGVVDEAPWNDTEHATGGGLTREPRPAWQNAPGDFIFGPAQVRTRIVPDVSADASGHLRVYWRGYGIGGVGGTSESAALVGAELAAINSLVPSGKRLLSTADLYMLANATPSAFRDVQRENDRGWKDNTLRPRRTPLPKDYRGILPSPTPFVHACAEQQNDGCTATTGFDAVSGIGSLLERAAVDALR